MYRIVCKILFCLGVLLMLWINTTLAENNESLWKRLYTLLRPFGTYKGDLSVAVSKATEKSGIGDILPRIILVDYANDKMNEWRPGRGTVEPAVCPDGKTVYMRRGQQLEYAVFDINESGLAAVQALVKLEGINVKHLYACTKDIREGSMGHLLWVQFSENQYGNIYHDNETIENRDLPSDLASQDPYKIMKGLSKLQGVREDGRHVWIRDRKLVVAVNPSHVNPEKYFHEYLFAGDPAWIGTTDYLIVTGLKD